MADFTDIVLFLTTGRVLAWIGAGPSVELGLPTWRGLANAVLEECRRKQQRNFPRIQRYYREGKYLEQFDEVALTYGTGFLHEICRDKVADPGGEGAIYAELSKLDFLSYFTTNYDDLLIRHLENSGKAVRVYSNSQEDLEAIDVDMTPSLVKLHGDFSDPDSVVLTRSDYQQRYLSGGQEGFQTFLRSHLARDRILFLGYSMSDPEILALQERLAVNLRRTVAPIALLANASNVDVEDWKRRYNIDVVPYPTSGSDHSALVSMLKSVSTVLSVGEFAQARIPDEDLRKAQALYMWHRFSPSAAGEAPIDALQALVLASLAKRDGRATLEELATAIRNDIGAHVRAESVELTGAVGRLVDEGWLTQAEGTVEVLPKAKQLVERYERQFVDLIEVFTRQLSLDLRTAIDVEEGAAREFAQVVLDGLIDIFELRGRDIMAMMFDAEPISPSGVTGLIQTIWRRANTVTDPNARASLVEFVLKMLTNPSGAYEGVLN